jgi:hypothetical protein
MRKRYAIKHLATKTGKKAKEMLVLTQVNDPFYIGSKSHYAAAEWARKLYVIMNRPKKVHIRRLHYFALTQPQHIKPSGQVYQNTSADWKFLCDACKFARYLQILPYDIFIDRWSIPKTVSADGYVRLPDGQVGFDSPEQWDKLVNHSVESLYRNQMNLILSRLMPCHIEIWVEKSTAADLIGPVSERYNIHIITALGELSLTAVWQFIKRIRRSSKPVRIFYISDFDPAGETMPVSVARKIEFLTRQYKLNRRVDIKLRPLILNRRQCKQFKLPGMPMPENTSRKFKFTRFNGRITTELHALEVARPGYIRKVVEDELNKHIDSSEILAAADEVRGMLRPFLEEIREMVLRRCEPKAIMKKFDKQLSIDWRAHQWRGPWLLDTKRDYLSQLTAYQLHKLR